MQWELKYLLHPVDALKAFLKKIIVIHLEGKKITLYCMFSYKFFDILENLFGDDFFQEELSKIRMFKLKPLS